MTLFVDTSAILALVDQRDPAHGPTVDAFELGLEEPLATHAYVVVETLAVARRRFDPSVAVEIIDRILPGIEISPVDADLRATSLDAFRQAIASSISLVDQTSFAFMRREGIERAIALDVDFTTAGFETLP